MKRPTNEQISKLRDSSHRLPWVVREAIRRTLGVIGSKPKSLADAYRVLADAIAGKVTPRVVRVDQQGERARLTLECGHEVWSTDPHQPWAECTRCGDALRSKP